MNNSFKKLTKLVLAIFGVAVCSHSCVLYGTPYSEYELKGKVVDETTDKPVQGLRIIRSSTYKSHGEIKVNLYEKDTVFTDDKGEFYTEGRDYRLNELNHILVEDIDSAQNGLYEDKEEFVELVKQSKPKSRGWFIGLYKSEVTLEVTPKR